MNQGSLFGGVGGVGCVCGGGGGWGIFNLEYSKVFSNRCPTQQIYRKIDSSLKIVSCFLSTVISNQNDLCWNFNPE